MTTDEKAAFLQKDYIQLLRTLSPVTAMRFGKLSLQGTVEHMSDAVRVGNAKDLHDLETLPEHLDKMRAFMLSDRPMREGTINPHMPAEPADLRYSNIEDAIGELEAEIADFFDLFAQDRQKLVTNPFFGELNYEQWVHLLHKHAWHHLRQAGVEEGW